MRHASLALLWLLAGCGGGTVVQQPPMREVAFASEQEGARRLTRGELSGAAKSFALAQRQFVALDDAEGVVRNRRFQARTALMQGNPAEALAFVDAARDDAESLLIAAQAHLDLAQPADAAAPIAAAEAICGKPCTHALALSLLRARRALATGALVEAEAQARTALTLAPGSGPGENSLERGNAHRLLAEALLGAGRATEADVEASAALALDRQAARPEKIARDWMLLGKIRRGAGAADARQHSREAYRHARDVAEAAGLRSTMTAADAALAEE